MFAVTIEKLSENELQVLIDNSVEESLRLDYKETIDLSRKRARLEHAKDVAALANTAGGRIVYGIREKEKNRSQKDGVPEALVGLSNRNLPRNLEDLLIDTIYPPVRFRMKEVELSGGDYALVVEVAPSEFDLHMVVGYGDSRFYRRSERRAVVMTEPEIRDRYVRVAQQLGSIEDQIDLLAEREMERRDVEGETFLVIPVFGRPGMLNPRLFDKEELRRSVPTDPDRHTVMFNNMKVTGDGYIAWLPPNRPLENAERFLHLRRDGILHAGTSGRFSASEEREPQFRPVVTLRELVWTSMLAKELLAKAGYWGAVRFYYRIHTPAARHVADLTDHCQALILPAGNLVARGRTTASDLYGDLASIVQQILDQVWQALGERFCPWFNTQGKLRDDVRCKLDFQVPDVL